MQATDYILSSGVGWKGVSEAVEMGQEEKEEVNSHASQWVKWDR